jgi:hypothetical protein
VSVVGILQTERFRRMLLAAMCRVMGALSAFSTLLSVTKQDCQLFLQERT